MLRLLSTNERATPGLLATPGAFAWWYADGLDEHGNGFVVIAAYGLPFLPGLASSWRRGEGPAPATRPSLNIALYRNFQSVGYWLQEFDGQEDFGRSRLHVGDGEVVLDVDMEVPGDVARLVGRIRVAGPSYVGADRVVTTDGPDHGWAPVLGPARATLHLSVADERFDYVGPAYADRNHGEVPLTSLGLSRWTWCRATLPDETRVVYALEGEGAKSWAVTIRRDGTASVAPARVRETGRLGWFGPPRRLVAEVDGAVFLDATVRSCIDRSPFYTRGLGTGRVGDTVGALTIEACEPDRIDAAWMRPLVRMAVHDTTGRPSMWLPLFNGPRATRWRRLFGRPALAIGDAGA